MAKRIITGIKEKVDELYFESFIDYILKLNLTRLSQSPEAKKWISTIRDAAPSSTPPSTQAAPAASGAQDTFTGSYSAEPKINISNFKGQYHSFTKWHTTFENVLSGAKVPKSE